MFQDALLFPHMDVEANLLYGQRLRARGGSRHRRSAGRRTAGPRRTAAAQAQDAFGRREATRRHRPRAARPAAHPALDEPLAALDVPRKAEILDYIERLRDELHIPIVYVSHSVAEISRLADTVVRSVRRKVPRRRRCGRRHGASRSQARDRTLRGGIADRNAGRGARRRRPADDARLRRRRTHRAASRCRDRGARARAHPCARRLARDAAAGGNQHPQCPAGARHGLDALSGPIVDVQLAVGSATLNARITRRSFQQLGSAWARTSTR